MQLFQQCAAVLLAVASVTHAQTMMQNGPNMYTATNAVSSDADTNNMQLTAAIANAQLLALQGNAVVQPFTELPRASGFVNDINNVANEQDRSAQQQQLTVSDFQNAGFSADDAQKILAGLAVGASPAASSSVSVASTAMNNMNNNNNGAPVAATASVSTTVSQPAPVATAATVVTPPPAMLTTPATTPVVEANFYPKRTTPPAASVATQVPVMTVPVETPAPVTVAPAETSAPVPVTVAPAETSAPVPVTVAPVMPMQSSLTMSPTAPLAVATPAATTATTTTATALSANVASADVNDSDKNSDGVGAVTLLAGGVGCVVAVAAVAAVFRRKLLRPSTPGTPMEKKATYFHCEQRLTPIQPSCIV